MHIDIEKLVAKWKDEGLADHEAEHEFKKLHGAIEAFYENGLITAYTYQYEVNMLDAAYTSYMEKAIYI